MRDKSHLLQGMGCETKGDWEDVWELGRVLPEIAKVANGWLQQNFFLFQTY